MSEVFTVQGVGRTGYRVISLPSALASGTIFSVAQSSAARNSTWLLNVSNAAALISAAETIGWTPTAQQRLKVRRGNGTTWRLCYIRGPDGVTVRLLEKLEG